MATPTEAEIIAQLQSSVHLLEEIREFGEVDATNVLGLVDAIEQDTEGDFSAQRLAAANAIRAQLSGTLAQHAALVDPVLLAWAKLLDVPERDSQGILNRVYDRLIASGDRVESRQFTYGAAVAGANVGDGVISRLTVDAEAFDLEAAHAETKTLEVINDQNSGADEHEEIFEVRGEDIGKDLLEISGSGRRVALRAQSARDSLLSNPSFSQFSGTIAVPTAITGWTPTTAIGNFQLSEAVTYRGFVGDTTPRSVQFDANDKLTQALSVRRTRLNPLRPYYLQVAYNRNGTGADGTLTIRLGSRSASVALAGAPAAAWALLTLAIDRNLWFERFNEDPLDVEIEVSGGATFGLLVDDVLLLPWTPIDGTWWLAVGGATPWLKDDVFTAADTEVGAVIQRWLWRAYGRYLPHATPAVTITDP